VLEIFEEISGQAVSGCVQGGNSISLHHTAAASSFLASHTHTLAPRINHQEGVKYYAQQVPLNCSLARVYLYLSLDIAFHNVDF